MVRNCESKEVCTVGVADFYGRDTVHHADTKHIQHGRPLTLSHLRLDGVGARLHPNLERRELEEVLNENSKEGHRPRSGAGGHRR